MKCDEDGAAGGRGALIENYGGWGMIFEASKPTEPKPLVSGHGEGTIGLESNGEGARGGRMAKTKSLCEQRIRDRRPWLGAAAAADDGRDNA